MRSNTLLVATAATLGLAVACGGDGGTPPTENAAPVADFTVPACTINVPCDFVGTGSDDVEVTGWSWDFDGDGTPDANTAEATFTYTAPGTYDVSLTVSDAEGLSHTRTSTLVIAPADPVNTPPTAGFTYACEAATCDFVSTSTDAAPGSVVAHAWAFGDGGTADVSDPSHTYAVTEPAEFTVTLTVTDDEGATGVATRTVSVAPAPQPNTPPTAGFTFVCNEGTCSFTSTSTDAAPGTIVAFAWDFGDGGTAAAESPSHTYAVTATTDFTVTLTVTDDDGATDVETQTVTVTPPPPAGAGCTTDGTRVDCAVDITARSVIKLRLLGVSCDLDKERVTIPPPIGDQVFLQVCSRAVGDSTMIFGGPLDEPIVFEPGSQVRIRFNQGTADEGEPAPAAPAGQITGGFPNWTINFEDGDNAGAPGEPDFTDVVLGVEAIPSP